MAERRRGPLLRFARLLLWAILGWIVLSCALVLSLRWIGPPTSAFMLRDDGPVRHHWVDWDEISPHVKVAVIAAEDQRFPDHRGFDFESINDALDDMQRGRRVRGASTITQQVAKNLFLWPGQSWLRKGLEAYFTVLIELFWPKSRILEVHLNIAEFGRGIYGIGAASETFFHKPAARLNAAEAALLAAVLPNPKRMRVDAPSRYMRSRQDWIMDQMSVLGGTSLLQRLD